MQQTLQGTGRLHNISDYICNAGGRRQVAALAFPKQWFLCNEIQIYKTVPQLVYLGNFAFKIFCDLAARLEREI